MDLTLYGIPNCGTVARARAWLEERGVAYRFHDFRRDGTDTALLAGWLEQTELQRLLNRRGTTWRRLSEAEQRGADDPQSALSLLAAHPSLIKRPVITDGSRVLAIGFEAQTYAHLFEAALSASPGPAISASSGSRS